MQYKSIESKIRVCVPDELDKELQILVERAKEEVYKSYAPYSHFCVGAAVLLENGTIVTGNNQENIAFPSGLCAERVALFYAHSQYPDVPVKAIAVAAYTDGRFLEEPVTPCGACRQVMRESEVRFEKEVMLLLYGTKYIYQIDNIKTLLPLSFEMTCVPHQ